MLFHLFIFFSHMNWSIHSYSVGKLTIRESVDYVGMSPMRNICNT